MIAQNDNLNLNFTNSQMIALQCTLQRFYPNVLLSKNILLEFGLDGCYPAGGALKWIDKNGVLIEHCSIAAHFKIHPN